MPPLTDRVVVGEIAVEVDVDGAGDVSGAERRTPIGLGERPAHVEHHGARLRPSCALIVEAAGELLSGDEDGHTPILPRFPHEAAR